MDPRLTLMAVHAHPDDEVMGTGGLLARSAEEGIRTVLVTCTNGEAGDDAEGRKPGDPGHDDAAVARARLAELRESAALLGIEHVELLGYRDSGMDGWSTNGHPDAFAAMPVEQAAAPLVELMERYRPQVVVTYDEKGGYGHPDHIQAHRIALAAADTTGIPDKLYYTAVPRSAIEQMMHYLRESADMGDFEFPDDFGVPDEMITTVLDVSAYAEHKIKALEAHGSQGDSMSLLQLPEEVRSLATATEPFIRQRCRVEAPDHESDLFAGLRAP